MRHSFTILLIASLITACSSDIEFDNKKWTVQQDLTGYKYRKTMLLDLTNNHLKKGMTKGQIVKLLGDPGFYNGITNEGDFGYLLNENYGWDIDPVEVDYFILTFKNDSLNGAYYRKWKQHYGTSDEEYQLNKK